MESTADLPVGLLRYGQKPLRLLQWGVQMGPLRLLRTRGRQTGQAHVVPVAVLRHRGNPLSDRSHTPLSGPAGLDSGRAPAPRHRREERHLAGAGERRGEVGELLVDGHAHRAHVGEGEGVRLVLRPELGDEPGHGGGAGLHLLLRRPHPLAQPGEIADADPHRLRSRRKGIAFTR